MTYTPPIFFHRYNADTLSNLAGDTFPLWTPQERYESSSVWSALSRYLSDRASLKHCRRSLSSRTGRSAALKSHKPEFALGA